MTPYFVLIQTLLLAGCTLEVRINQIFISMIPGGQPVDVQLYANPRTPLTPQGTPAANENFSRLEDHLPLVKATYVDSGKPVSDVYWAIVEGANTDGVTRSLKR